MLGCNIHILDDLEKDTLCSLARILQKHQNKNTYL